VAIGRMKHRRIKVIDVLQFSFRLAY